MEAAGGAAAYPAVVFNEQAFLEVHAGVAGRLCMSAAGPGTCLPAVLWLGPVHLPPCRPALPACLATCLPTCTQAMSVVLAHAAYLPAAQCFALLPLAGAFRRTGSGSGAVLDYDVERAAVTVVAQRSYRCARARRWGWVGERGRHTVGFQA